MSTFSAKEAARVLGLPLREVRLFRRAGLLEADGDAGRLTFRDLVLLRAASELRRARVPAAKVRRALRRLRESLPVGRPLSAVSLEVRDGRILVRDGETRIDAETGQVAFRWDDDGDRTTGATPAPMPFHLPLPEELTAEDWYEVGFDLEEQSEDEALEAYRRALELDPDHFDAHINLGRLYVLRGDLDAAEAEFRAALRAGPHAIAWFNLGVVLEERGDADGALAAYRKAIAVDPHCAEAYFNLSRLLRIVAEAEKVMRHDPE